MISRSTLAAGVLATWLWLGAGAAWAGPDEPVRPDPWTSQPNVGLGPFEMGSLSPFNSLRSGFAPVLPSSLAAGRFEARLDQNWAKVISSTTDWLIDYEVLETRAGFAWGVTDLFSVDVEADSSERARGGALQRVILGFHRAFGVTTSYLTPYPGDLERFHVVPPGGGPAVDVPANDPEPFESAGLFALRQTLTRGDECVPALAAALQARRTLAPGDLRGGAPVDLSGSLGASKAAGAFVFTAGADIEWYGEGSFFGIPLRSTQWAARAGAEWRFLPSASFTAQYLLKRGAVKGLADFSLPTNEISAGFAWEVSAGVKVELGILENAVNPYNTPDFGFYAAAALRW